MSVCGGGDRVWTSLRILLPNLAAKPWLPTLLVPHPAGSTMNITKPDGCPQAAAFPSAQAQARCEHGIIMVIFRYNFNMKRVTSNRRISVYLFKVMGSMTASILCMGSHP